jgi:hypothetical protein
MWTRPVEHTGLTRTAMTRASPPVYNAGFGKNRTTPKATKNTRLATLWRCNVDPSLHQSYSLSPNACEMLSV